ncbi:hypothetical protein GCM10023085_46130 [Actinomadura viridis]|uniref:Uncharacterized protein n=1 Tax=Actinomadura viridis TaxID=58110 RepID=A0A931GJP7_9ACTN|nr:hypothetical protein [Actinomadura viridis]MBG6089973.1 hypothetical protein [Actinomadura viridis]
MADRTIGYPQALDINAGIRALERRRPYTTEVAATVALLEGIRDCHHPAHDHPEADECVCGGEWPCIDVSGAMTLAAAIVEGEGRG